MPRIMIQAFMKTGEDVTAALFEAKVFCIKNEIDLALVIQGFKVPVAVSSQTNVDKTAADVKQALHAAHTAAEKKADKPPEE